MLRMAGTMAQRIDWLVSRNDGEESFMRRWDEEIGALKEKDGKRKTDEI